MNAKRAKPNFSRYVSLRLLEAFGDLPLDCVTLLEYASIEALRESLTARTDPGESPPPSDLPRFASHIVYNIGERALS